MTNGINNKKADLILRKNKGRQILNSWVEGFIIASMLNLEDISFVSLEETDSLKTNFVSKMQHDNKIFRFNIEINRKAELYSTLKHMASLIGPLRVIMFTDVDKYLGAVDVPADSVLIRAKNIWNYIGNDFVLLDNNLDSGICIEINYYNLQGSYEKNGVLEINSWGKLELRGVNSYCKRTT
jgi:hypothetical protein